MGNERQLLRPDDLILEDGIGPLVEMAGKSRVLPVIEIPPQSPRSDQQTSIKDEASNFMGIRRDGEISCALSVPAAPHTPIQVPTPEMTRIVRETSGKDPVYPFTSDTMAAHMLVWMWNDNIPRCDTTKLSYLNDEARQRHVNLIGEQTGVAVSVLQQLLSLSNESASKTLRMYGLWGHGTAKERIESGLSPGALSQEDFHFSLAYLPDLELSRLTSMEKVTREEFLKQIGAWDTVTFHLFNAPVQRRIASLVAKRLEGGVASVTAQQVHGSNTDGSAVRFHDGYRIKFQDGIPYNVAWNVLLDVIKDSDELYEGLKQRYELYQKYAMDPDAHDITKDTLAFVHTRGFEGRAAERLVALIMQLKPTCTQVESMINELRDKGTSSDNRSLRRLQKLSESYERVQNKMKANGEKFLAGTLKGNYDISETEALMLSKMLEDTAMRIEVKEDPVTRNVGLVRAPQFTMPVHMSGSYLFDDYDIREDRQIAVNSISVSTRLGSTKGALEDAGGFVVRRKRPL